MKNKRLRLRLFLIITTVVVFGLAALTCSGPRPMTEPLATLDIHSQPWRNEHHHTNDGFRNTWGEQRDTPFFKSAGWILGHAFQKKENIPPAVQPVDPDTLRVPPEHLRITWLGHATSLIQTPALTVLTDPMFSERASPFSFAGPERNVPLPLRPEDLPGLDVVLISHDHYDHLDEHSIRTLERLYQPLFLVPLGVGSIVQGWGAQRIVEMDWWQYVDFNGWRIHCTPARHFSGRGLTNRNGTLWASWYLEANDGSLALYYAGDTGYARHFREIRERLGAPDVALIPIGAYLPRWFMEVVHVDPAQAVQAFLDLDAAHFIPVHWGTFDLADEPLQEPPEQVRQAAGEQGLLDQLHLLDVGESFVLEQDAASPARPNRSSDSIP